LFNFITALIFISKIKNSLLNLYYIIKERLGIGDWGLGIGPNPQSPIPNPQI